MPNSPTLFKVIMLVLVGAFFATSAAVMDTWEHLNLPAAEQQKTLAPQAEVLNWDSNN
jgi:biopolymer transport protein ExbD